jgi:hypothetical protein
MKITGIKTVAPQNISATNPIEGDIFIGEDGSIAPIGTDNEAIVQQLRERLMSFRGDYFLNLSEGIPWIQHIFQKGTTEAQIKQYISQALLSHPLVSEVSSIALTHNRATRHLTIAFVVRTNDSRNISSADFGPVIIQADQRK